MGDLGPFFCGGGHPFFGLTQTDYISPKILEHGHPPRRIVLTQTMIHTAAYDFHGTITSGPTGRHPIHIISLPWETDTGVTIGSGHLADYKIDNATLAPVQCYILRDDRGRLFFKNRRRSKEELQRRMWKIGRKVMKKSARKSENMRKVVIIGRNFVRICLFAQKKQEIQRKVAMMMAMMMAIVLFNARQIPQCAEKDKKIQRKVAMMMAIIMLSASNKYEKETQEIQRKMKMRTQATNNSANEEQTMRTQAANNSANEEQTSSREMAKTYAFQSRMQTTGEPSDAHSKEDSKRLGYQQLVYIDPTISYAFSLGNELMLLLTPCSIKQ